MIAYDCVEVCALRVDLLHHRLLGRHRLRRRRLCRSTLLPATAHTKIYYGVSR